MHSKSLRNKETLFKHLLKQSDVSLQFTRINVLTMMVPHIGILKYSFFQQTHFTHFAFKKETNHEINKQKEYFLV